MNILVVDDDAGSRESLADAIQVLNHTPTCCANAEAALALLKQKQFSLLITDIRMPGINGIELLEKVKADPALRDMDVVLVTGHSDVGSAIASFRRGAFDYLLKPVNFEELEAIVERSAERQALLQENLALNREFERCLKTETAIIQGKLAQAQEAIRRLSGVGEYVAAGTGWQEMVAKALLFHRDPQIPILIEGETGTGKEILARLVHFGEGDTAAPFVDLNCSALAPQLVESELFGYEAGAFTGAAPKGAPGKLEVAGEGTLFLDEIGDLPLDIQPKLLRVLETRSYYRINGVKRLSFRARVICATNRNLIEMVRAGKFREDLFHRLSVGVLRPPPLRERREAIRPLIDFFLRRACARRKIPLKRFSPAALSLLESYDWPGNIRELENLVERAALLVPYEVIEDTDIDLLGDPESATAARLNKGGEVLTLPANGIDLEELTAQLIRRAMEKFDGNQTRAAAFLGMSRMALHRRLKKMGMA